MLGMVGLVEIDGILVERDALRIAEKIREIDENLILQYLEEATSLGQPPFRVLERLRDGSYVVAFTAWQLDDRLIERIHLADTYRGIDPLKAVEDAEALVKKNNERRYKEKMLEATEITAAIIRSPKDTYSLKNEDGEKIIFKA